MIYWKCRRTTKRISISNTSNSTCRKSWLFSTSDSQERRGGRPALWVFTQSLRRGSFLQLGGVRLLGIGLSKGVNLTTDARSEGLCRMGGGWTDRADWMGRYDFDLGLGLTPEEFSWALALALFCLPTDDIRRTWAGSGYYCVLLYDGWLELHAILLCIAGEARWGKQAVSSRKANCLVLIWVMNDRMKARITYSIF